MGRLEVQGIVSTKNGLPLVQFRQLDDEGNLEAGWESDVADAREMAQQIVEAAMNATYDAAIVAWVKEMDPDNYEETSARLLTVIRRFRADQWGLPDNPNDWRTN